MISTLLFFYSWSRNCHQAPGGETKENRREFWSSSSKTLDKKMRHSFDSSSCDASVTNTNRIHTKTPTESRLKYTTWKANTIDLDRRLSQALYSSILVLCDTLETTLISTENEARPAVFRHDKMRQENERGDLVERGLRDEEQLRGEEPVRHLNIHLQCVRSSWNLFVICPRPLSIETRAQWWRMTNKQWERERESALVRLRPTSSRCGSRLNSTPAWARPLCAALTLLPVSTHKDAPDNFCVHVSGKKRWEIKEPCNDNNCNSRADARTDRLLWPETNRALDTAAGQSCYTTQCAHGTKGGRTHRDSLFLTSMTGTERLLFVCCALFFYWNEINGYFLLLLSPASRGKGDGHTKDRYWLLTWPPSLSTLLLFHFVIKGEK